MSMHQSEHIWMHQSNIKTNKYTSCQLDIFYDISTLQRYNKYSYLVMEQIWNSLPVFFLLLILRTSNESWKLHLDSLAYSEHRVSTMSETEVCQNFLSMQQISPRSTCESVGKYHTFLVESCLNCN